MRKYLVVILVLLSVSVPLAWGHPFTEKTIPNLSSNAPAGTTEVIVVFSQAVDIDFSEIKVFDNNGEQVDNRDTRYHEGEESLIVTTPPLQDGIYTASTKVLSKIDGHLVPGTFLFAVGDVIVDPSILESKGPEEIVYVPGAAAKFPGLVGQTIVLGAAVASLMVWGTQNKRTIMGKLEAVERIHHGRFMLTTGVGLVLVLVSDVLIIVVQSVKLDASPFTVLGTGFGAIWIARMIMTVVLLGIWFAMNKKTTLSGRAHVPILAASLALIATTSMVGHGSSLGGMAGLALDYVHNLVAAVWIGGIFYLVFTLLPALSGLADREKEHMSLAMVPRFSMLFVVSVGVVIVTGPVLMWLIESDVGLITESVFGQLVMLKIALAGIMVGMGGYVQFRVQAKAERNIRSGGITVHKKIKRMLKTDIVLGFAILGIVALLTNGTLPAGEIQKTEASQTVYGYGAVEFTENARFEVEMFPFSSGTNTLSIRTAGLDGSPLYDLDGIKVKVSNPSRNIFPIEVPMEQAGESEFQGEMTLGFSGEWLMEITAQRTESASESIILDLSVKPRLGDIRVEVVEYEFPEEAKPLQPVYDGAGSIWISDLSAPRVWQFSIETQEFSSYSYNGVATTFVTSDGAGRVWFTDSPRNQIGYVDIRTGNVTTVSVPHLDPTISRNALLTIQADRDGNVWTVVVNKDRIVKYLPESGVFEEIVLPGRETLPFALAVNQAGTVWYSTAGTGKIGYVDPATGRPVEISADRILNGPEAMLFDDEGNLWIAEHAGLAITRFNPVLETFESVSVPDQEALPFGMAQDRYGNVWFAQHVIDKIAVFDPDNGDLLEVPIPTETSFIQFMTTDGDGNVWFAEQESSKIGTVRITEVPVTVEKATASDDAGLTYSEIASPLMAAGIVASALFYVKAVHDKRRINGLISQDGAQD